VSKRIKDFIADAHDPLHKVATGAPAKAERRELVYDLVALLTNTMNDKISGINFNTNLDLVGNYLHELRAYATSLKTAAAVIQDGYPTADDEPLMALQELSDILIEGANRSEQYLMASRQFATDLNNIRNEIASQVNHLHQEL
jgi:hypothetical protein